MKISAILGRLTALVILSGAVWIAHHYQLLQKAIHWMEPLGAWAPVVFLLIYTLTAILFVPSFFFTFAAGALFGLAGGLPLALAGSGLGAVGALLIGRYLARQTVEHRLARHPRFAAIIEAISEQGWKVVLLARLSPIFPFLIANYAFGVTRIRAAAYFLASLIGTLPSTTVYTYMGTLAGSLAAGNAPEAEKTPAQWILLIAGFVATVALVIYIRRISRAALEKKLAPPQKN